MRLARKILLIFKTFLLGLVHFQAINIQCPSLGDILDGTDITDRLTPRQRNICMQLLFSK